MEKKVLSFNEFINESYAIRINEEDSLSGDSSNTVLVGASKSDTSSKSAVNRFKDSIDGLVIEGDLKTEGALFRDSNKKKDRKKDLYYQKKTSKEKHYIKIGDQKISGDAGKTVNISLTFEKIVNEDVEAAGNGIYAFGRLWKLFREKEVGPKDEVVLVLNLKNPGGFISSVKTGFQDLDDSFAQSCLYALIATDAIIPNEKNTEKSVKLFKEKKWPVDEYFVRRATPYINMGEGEEGKEKRKEMLDKMGKKGKIDISKTIADISNKKLDKKGKNVDALVKKITDAHLEDYIKVSGERFNEFLDISAENAGIPKDLFNPMKKKVETWKETEIKKKDDYYKRAKTYADLALSATFDGETRLVSGAKASGKKVKKGEGEY